jgi:hypothetical protein
MVLGFIMIGWICGGTAGAVYLSFADASFFGALAVFSVGGAASIAMTAVLTVLPTPRLLQVAVRSDGIPLASPTATSLIDDKRHGSR